MYKATDENQDYSQELIYDRQGYRHRPDSVIIKHHNANIWSKINFASYVSEEFLEPYYLRIETQKTNEGVYTITFYDKDGNIFRRWQGRSNPYYDSKIRDEFSDYMRMQKELRENK